MDLQTFEKLVKSANLPNPVYIFAGPETFLKQKAFDLIAKVLVPEDEQNENVNKIVCNGKELPELINLIYSFSFNPSPRLFFIQDIDNVTAKQRKDFLEKLKNGGVPVETILVFTVKDSKVATELSTAFKQRSDKIDFWAPFANKLGEWVRKETVELGAEMAPDAAEQLIELAGSDLALLHQEITKLALAKPGSKILLADVNKSVAYVKQDTAYDFIEAFSKRQPSKALRILESLNNRGESIQKLWYMLVKQIREFRLFHSLYLDRPDVLEPIMNCLRKYRGYADKSDFSSNQAKKNILTEIQNAAEAMPDGLADALNLRLQNKIKSLYLVLNFTNSELVALWPQMIEFDSKLKSGIPDPLAAMQVFVSDILCMK